MTKGYEGTISVFELFEMIPDEEAAIEYMENIRWEDGVCCPALRIQVHDAIEGETLSSVSNMQAQVHGAHGFHL